MGGGSNFEIKKENNLNLNLILKEAQWLKSEYIKQKVRKLNSFEREEIITTANAWQELTFDYTAISTTNSYQKLVFIFDLGTVGDASANYTFYFDSVILTN
jgi:hypothetical protein